MGSVVEHWIYHVIIFRYWKNCRSIKRDFIFPGPQEERELINESYRDVDY